MRITSHLAAAAGLAVVAAVAAAAVWPDPMPVDVAAVVEGPMQVTIDEDGLTRVRDRFVVSAPVAGRLERVELEPGDAVRRGAAIGRLVPAAPPLLDARVRAELTAAVEAVRAALGQARAEHERAVAAQARAQASLHRLAGLAAAGAISVDELEAAETAAKDANGTVSAAAFAVAKTEHELELARARLRVTPIGGAPVEVKAPVEGIVLRRLRESESIVPAGEPLLEIGDLGQLEVVADLLSADAVRLSGGCVVYVDHGGNAPLIGHISRIEPAGFTKISALGVEEHRVNVVIALEAPPAARRLGDGYRVEIRAVVWQTASTVKVPSAA